MLSLVVFVVFLGICLIAFRFPVIGAIGYVWYDVFSPQALFVGKLSDFRYSLVLFVALLTGMAFRKEFKIGSANKLLWIFLVFCFWAALTTLNAQNPEFALAKAEVFFKNSAIVVLLMMLCRTRERLEAFLYCFIVAFFLYAVRGVWRSVVSGGAGDYNLEGAASTYLGGRNVISMACATSIPLTLWLAKHSVLLADFRFRKPLLWGVVGILVLGLVSSNSRGAVVGLIVASLVLWRYTSNKFSSLAVAVGVVFIAAIFAGAKWQDRISGIADASENDGSAQGRISAWIYAYNWAVESPLFGGGFQIFRNHFPFVWNPTEWIDAHSVYFEVLGEHGFIGLTIFLFFCLSVLWGLFRQCKSSDVATRDLAIAGFASQAATLTCLAFLNGSYILISYTPVLVLVYLVRRAQFLKA
jgi:probable O-glycosylation ligase (exosortase A-associated)